MRELTCGSLFSGAGLMDWGLTLAGFQHRWFCERDAYCRRILELRWPGVPVYDDVRTLDHPERVDLLAGGFPCQDISVAGRGAGIEGNRSGLWSEYARLIRTLQPSYVLVENVPALLARGLGRVLGDLAACGYDAEWDCLPASAFGAPHQRDRIWIVAYPQGGGGQGEPSVPDAEGALVGAELGADGGDRERGLAEGVRLMGSGAGGRDGRGAAMADTDGEGRSRRRGGNGIDVAPNQHRQDGRPTRSGWLERDVQDAYGSTVQPRRLRWGAPRTGSAGWWASEPDVGRVAHGVPSRLDRLAAIGNGVVPQVSQWLGERIVERERMRAAA